MKRLLRRIFPIGLAILLLLYALKDTSLASIGDQFRKADYRWLLLVAFQIGLYTVVRAARWRLTLQALGYQPSLVRTTIAILAGTLASLIIPGAGELTRCGTLQRTDDIPLAQGFGSVVAERVIDLLMLGLLVGLTILVEFKRVGVYFSDLLTPLLARLAPNQPLAPLFLTAVLAGLLLLGFVGWFVQTKGFRQHTLVRKLMTIGREIGRGFMSIQRLRQPGWFVCLTVVSYVLIYLANYTLFAASTQTVTLPPAAALSVMAASSLGGLAVPTQGGVGTYHFLVSRVLMLYGMPEAESVAKATFMHAVQTGFALLLSSISFLIVPILIRQKARRLHEHSA
ncbi:lysylphosphatidylglycerol synthase transmembrane domain-containing protein [Spirosoma agri]|uniref:Flippase-like domain-containing protein n=1 Tax=Spirosoma agri TaxID=1987381 RepID=A0A6M0IBY5_9BACT|nr:lysylphosphatidylglycerol synthase transmembrane domain-containing protein [Spirosoma agri]NEU65588.1 flippase-like domain-containing protein [Spirosoma agri]